ncbi:sporulation protein [Shimazuella kribbensis]|uniref:sporulation protein n=1 Tax=Shimazuella kribbensis TaxID=139808 RepID=UPI0004016D5B|nr:sporulation protein [Shimazuella kribbensis]
MFNWISSVGIGAAKVDTHLERDQYAPGDVASGEVMIIGGIGSQQFDQIELHLMLQYREEGSYKNKSYLSEVFRISGPIQIAEHEVKRIPFQLTLPETLPMSTGHFPTYIRTVLDAKFAVDPKDEDRITLLPAKLVQHILKVIEDAGFILYKIENLELIKKPKIGLPFMQVFVFRPVGSNHGVIDEYSMVFTHSATSFKMEMEILRAEQALQSTFEWDHRDPENTFRINGTSAEGNPFERLRSLLKRK